MHFPQGWEGNEEGGKVTTKPVNLNCEPTPDIWSSRVMVYLETWGLLLVAFGLYKLVDLNR